MGAGMSYVPLNYNAFFERLGPKFVQNALINGEFFGETKERAQFWLKEHKDARKIKLILWTMIVTLFAGAFGGVATLLARFL